MVAREFDAVFCDGSRSHVDQVAPDLQPEADTERLMGVLRRALLHALDAKVIGSHAAVCLDR